MLHFSNGFSMRKLQQKHVVRMFSLPERRRPARSRSACELFAISTKRPLLETFFGGTASVSEKENLSVAGTFERLASFRLAKLRIAREIETFVSGLMTGRKWSGKEPKIDVAPGMRAADRVGRFISSARARYYRRQFFKPPPPPPSPFDIFV